MYQPEQVLQVLLKAIVANPDEVKVVVQNDAQGTLLRIWVNREDMGVVIGKLGQHAKALKLMAKLVGQRCSQFITLKIEEPI